MKILYVTDVFPPRCGGSGWSVYFFARALRERGHQVDLIALDGENREYDGFRVEAFRLSRGGLPFSANWKRESREIPELAVRLKTMAAQYDVVHAQHKLSALAVMKAGLPKFFVTIRDYWPVCICGRSMFRSGFLCSRKDFLRCSFHDGWWKGVAAPFAYSWFEARLKERLRDMQAVHRIFCISHHVREQLLPFFEPEKLDVLPNFAEEIRTPAPPNLPERFIAYVGRLEENKGPQLLPEILAEAGAGLPVVVVGEGSLQAKMEAEFAARGVAATFAGYREYPEMLSIVARSEFVVFPSRWAEPLGRVLIEAAMMGKAAVAFSHAGGHRDIVENENTGLLADSPKDFADAVARLASDAGLRETLGHNARLKYERAFHPDVILPRLLHAYEA